MSSMRSTVPTRYLDDTIKFIDLFLFFFNDVYLLTLIYFIRILLVTSKLHHVSILYTQIGLYIEKSYYYVVKTV